MNEWPKIARAVLLVLGLFSLRVMSATLQGSVRDSRGTAAAGATIQIQNGAGILSTVVSDATGNYRVSSLAAGTYMLRAKVGSGSEAASGPLVLSESETKKVDLVLQPGTASLDFFEEPQFTVAGVTDHTYVGGHGSDTVVRSAEALTKATASLSKDAPAASRSSAAANEAEAHRRMAEADERQRKPLDAVREYQRAAELDASETNLFDWGTELLTHRAPEPAVEVFAKGIRLFPQSSRMLLGAAVGLYAKGDYDQAARRFFEAADLNPADPNPYLFLGRVQSPEITDSPGFLERLARFVQLQPDNAWANYYYAINLWKLRQNPADADTLSRVQALLEKAVLLDPTLAAVHLQLGILYSEKQDVAAAIRAYQRAIEVDLQLEQAHYRLAQAYRQTGETQKARQEMEVFHQVSKTSAQSLQRERSELQQFVVTLKSPVSNQ